MGNTNQPARGTGDLGNAAMKGWPVLFHNTHSENIQLSLDRRRAKRAESFCKGICFSNRPIAINERVYLRFAEVSTSWSGVLRFGFTAHDPATLNAAQLPKYACPDLTNKPGYWAKALGERYSEQGTVVFFYVTRGGDIMYGINGEEKGVFFSGVQTNVTLWALVDIYGNTMAMEFIDGRQLNNLSPSSGLPPGATIEQDLPNALAALSMIHTPPPTTPVFSPQHSHHVQGPPLPARNIPTHHGMIASTPQTATPSAQSHGHPPVPQTTPQGMSQMCFHPIMGRNICLSSDKTVAVRLVEEYCNGYVFTIRPLQCGQKLVIQILSVDKAYCGGLAFGLTACDPASIRPHELPDDSDLLLDRMEYWVVNKDVCSQPEVGDELSFHLTEEGEVRYGKNGHQIAVLMHVDKTLPLWAFFDVYGSTQKIKCLGILQPGRPGQGSPGQPGLTVALPPPRSQSSTPPLTSSVTPPPRPPPPPRTSISMGHAIGESPPQLPPKPQRPLPPQPGQILIPTPAPSMMGRQQPLVPTPAQPALKPSPVVPSVTANASAVVNCSIESETNEAADNATNECSVCFEKPVDCVLYTCGHMCMCFECAMDVKSKHNLCPICRNSIKDVIKIYRS